MRKTKWKTRIVVQPMNWNVFVTTPSSLAAFCQWLLDQGADPVEVVKTQIVWEDSLSSGGAMFSIWGENYILVLPEEFDDQLVYHEALHCAINLWKDAGAQLDIDFNEEVLTYTQGHVVQLLKKHIYKIPEKKPCQSAKLKAVTAGEAAEKSIRQKPRLRSRGVQSKRVNTRVVNP